MTEFLRSICSTCRYLPNCVLSSDKSNISSCSEYVHRLDENYPPVPTEPIKLLSSYGIKNDKEDKQLVLH